MVSLSLIPQVVSQNLDIHDVEVANIFLSERYLSCQKNLYFIVELRNSGTESEAVHAELFSPSMGMREFSPVFAIQSDESASLTIPVSLEVEPEGEHEVEVAVYFNNEINQGLAHFNFEGCKEEKQEIQLDTSMPQVQQSYSFNDAKASIGDWSAQLVFVVIMVAVIFFLVLIYLLKILFQKITRNR